MNKLDKNDETVANDDESSEKSEKDSEDVWRRSRGWKSY